MSDNPLIAVAVADQEPAGVALPVPTPEQERTADQVFTRPVEHHAAFELLGMVASVQFLHELAGEMFRKSKQEELEPDGAPELRELEEPE